MSVIDIMAMKEFAQLNTEEEFKRQMFTLQGYLPNVLTLFTHFIKCNRLSLSLKIFKLFSSEFLTTESNTIPRLQNQKGIYEYPDTKN